MNTDPLSTLSIRAEMKITARRENLLGFAGATAGASITGLASVSCALSLLNGSDAVVVHVFLGTVCAIGALFTGRAAIRSYRELLFNAMTDINRIMTLQLENDNFRGRLWDIYLGRPVEGEAAGEEGHSSGGAASPAANVFPINSKPKGRFQ